MRQLKARSTYLNHSYLQKNESRKRKHLKNNTQQLLINRYIYQFITIQISRIQIEDNKLNETLKKERAELQNLITLIQSIRRSIQGKILYSVRYAELEEEIDGMSLSIADQESENAELKRSFQQSSSVCWKILLFFVSIEGTEDNGESIISGQLLESAGF